MRSRLKFLPAGFMKSQWKFAIESAGFPGVITAASDRLLPHAMLPG
jgi:hypothetical protein